MPMNSPWAGPLMAAGSLTTEGFPEQSADAIRAPVLQKVRAEKDLLQDRCPDMTVMLQM